MLRVHTQGGERRLRRAARNAVGTDHNHALALATVGKRAEALALEPQLLPRAQTAFGPKHPLVIEIELNIGVAALATGNRTLAESTLLRARSSALEALGPDHEHTLEIEKALAELRK